MAKFEIAGVEVKPGRKVYKWISLGKTYYGELKIPFIGIGGTSPGKTLFLISGIHGTEYVGLEAILRFCEELDPKKLRGNLVSIPFINVPAFEYITRETPFDGLNLNRVFPGKKGGFLSERMANFIVEKVLPNVDYAIDIHGARSSDMQNSLVGFVETEELSSLDVAKAFGIETLWRLSSSGIKGDLTTESAAHGVSAIVVEVGGESRCKEEWVQTDLDGFRNVMISLKMLRGKPSKLPAKYIVMEGFYQYCSSGGFLRSKVGLKERVKKGQVLGTIVDLLGKQLEVLKAEKDGVIHGLRTLPKINPGDWTYWVGAIKEEIRR
jgi:predicted deacylase